MHAESSDRVHGWSGALLAVAVVLFPLGISGPAQLFAPNSAEFNSSLTTLYLWFVPVTAALMAIGVLLLCLLPTAARSVAISLCISIGLGLYIQGSYLVWDYGALDGTGVDWSAHILHGVTDSFVWVGLLLGAILGRDILVRHTGLICSSLLAIHAVSGAIAIKDLPPLEQFADADNLDSSFFEFSLERNAVVIVLDQFSSSAFDRVLGEDPKLGDRLNGFTYFSQATGPFPTTYLTVPAILTGRIYRNEMPIEQFLSASFSDLSLPNALENYGFRSQLVTLKGYCAYLQTHDCTTLREVSAGRQEKVAFNESLMLSDLVLFRYLPQVGKYLVFNNQEWLLQRWLGSGFHAAHWFISESMGAVDTFLARARLTEDSKRFKFIHLLVPHKPFQTDSQCQLIPSEERERMSERDRYDAQAKCALKLALNLLDGMKEMGIYRDSVVVILSDHGYAPRARYDDVDDFVKRGIDRALPLLMVKSSGANGPLRTSQAPAEISDVTRTVVELLGYRDDLPGLNVMNLESDLNRKRSYYHYFWTAGLGREPYLPLLQEYVVKGSPHLSESWSLGARLPPGPSEGRGSENFSDSRKRRQLPSALGHVSISNQQFGDCVVRGWVVHPQDYTAPQLVKIYAGEEHVASAKEFVPRAGVAKKYGSRALRSGIRIPIEASIIQNKIVGGVMIDHEGRAAAVNIGQMKCGNPRIPVD